MIFTIIPHLSSSHRLLGAHLPLGPVCLVCIPHHILPPPHRWWNVCGLADPGQGCVLAPIFVLTNWRGLDTDRPTHTICQRCGGGGRRPICFADRLFLSDPTSNYHWALNISGSTFSRPFEFRPLLRGIVSFTHAVAALIRCFALVTVARAESQLVNRGHATHCTSEDVFAFWSVVCCPLVCC